jgi:integrase/recombinase XerD
MFESDSQLIAAWLHGRPETTQRAYRADITGLLAYIQAPIRAIRLQDIQSYADRLKRQKLKPATIQRRLNAARSLFAFAQKQGYIQTNPAIALKTPKANLKLAGRILTPEEVKGIITAPPKLSNRLFLKFTYATGARISEACGLKWDDFDVQPKGAIQVSLLGKGDKLRSVVIPATLWEELQAIRTDRDSVFRLSTDGADKLIRRATRAAGVSKKVSCHWLRHAHASHSLNNGAPLQVVRDTLGHSSVAVTNQYLEAYPEQSSSSYLEL